MANIICERRIYNNCFNTHSHLYGQLILPIKGRMYIETENRKFEINNNNLFFLPPQCMHIFKADESNEFLTLDVNGGVLNKNDIKSLEGGKEIKFDDKWKAIRYLLLNECKEKNNSAAINDLFNYCYHLIMKESTFKSLEFINEHFDEDINLNLLADMEHYNPAYYSEWFKKNLGTTVTEYIKKLRIQKAKELLLNTDLSVLQIAQMVGYEHNSSFTRIFKEYEKKSPAELRRDSKKLLKIY